VQTEGQGYLREEGDKDNEQFSSTEIRRGYVVCRYWTEVRRDRRRSVRVVQEGKERKRRKGGKRRKRRTHW
jgi:hypothetical protein